MNSESYFTLGSTGWYNIKANFGPNYNSIVGYKFNLVNISSAVKH